MAAEATLVERIEADIAKIRTAGDRTGSLEKHNLRWIGEPNGWRLMGDLADDLEIILQALKTQLDDGK